MIHDIEVKGQYIYINQHSIRFDSEEQAQEFMIKLISESGFLK
jgi:hypothetical protein